MSAEGFVTNIWGLFERPWSARTEVRALSRVQARTELLG